MKKILSLALAAVVAAGSFAVAPVEAYTDYSLGANRIGRVGAATKTVYKGGELDLEVRKAAGLRERDIQWSIANENVVTFDDYDVYDDEVEVRALKTGTTKVTAKNLVTGGKIVYTVKVKAQKQTISRVGKKARSVTAGNEFELRVKKNGRFSDSNLYWSTSNSNVVRIVDDRYDDEIELRAVKAGKAKITCKNKLTGGKIVYNVTVKKGNGTISRVGSASRTVEVGDDVELNVRKSGLNNSQIKWYISDSRILRFEDGDNVGTEVEVSGKRTGTAKVTAKNMVTGGKITYTITVVPDYDDDWDDEWDD